MKNIEEDIGTSSIRIVEITIWIPSADREGRALGRVQQAWKERAIQLLGNLFGASTASPPCDGAWKNPKTNQLIREKPILVYTYVAEDEAQNREKLREIGAFCREMGKATRQGEVALKIGDRLMLIETW